VEVVDRLHGAVTGVIDDFVVRRADGAPAYQVAVVVDDDDQGVGEVVRGDDLLDTTPRQVWLARRLGLVVPVYAHVPLVLGPDGRRLAKRHGAVTLSDLRAGGVGAPEALTAMAVSLGLAAVGSTVTSVRDLVAGFDPDRLPRDPWRFDPASLPGRPGPGM
jgi:glutamyl-tRNA synthetase